MAASRHITFTIEDERFSSLNQIQKEAIGSETILTIESRTSRGIDKNGDPFESYNRTYRDSQHFKDAGKSSVVNLEFSSDMINSMVFLPNLSSGNKVTVGFVNGSTENERAQFVIDGHGRKGDFTQPKRDFMGLTSSEQNIILGGISNDNEDSVFSSLSDSFLDSIF